MVVLSQIDRLRSAWQIGLMVLALALPTVGVWGASELRSFQGCQFVRESWADGDSFPVWFPDGAVRSVRLYGVDCLESTAGASEATARRMIEQRRWFGMPNVAEVQKLGLEGKRETERILAKPFTVHTSFTDARGDARYQRIYGFVTLADGRDLSEHLVSMGLARAFGVVRALADGTRGEEWRERLRGLERQASQKSLGAWALTDWDRLAEERRAAHQDEAELAKARGGKTTRTENQAPIDLNNASRDELMALPGVGEVMARRIIENRPYSSVTDILRVPGIGEKTLKVLRPHLWIRGKKG